MTPPQPPVVTTTRLQRQLDGQRLRRAVQYSLACVLVLTVVFALQGWLSLEALTVNPGSAAGLFGVLTAPLLHGSPGHLLANATALLMLGTLAMTVYPRATLRALPLLWLGAGLGAWLLGQPGSHHLGASGVIHGLGFLVFVLGLLRRDSAAIAAGMLAFLFYGGMLLTIFPHEVGVSWESHLGGALAGVVAAFVFRRSDPMPQRRKYSWEIEEELERERAAAAHDTFEPRAPDDVPVLWQRDEQEERGKVLPFRSHDKRDD
ncbi:rhomboid family intramembrane serine protease [Thermomonas sp.]|uniref:rhomboid family intramembrane serine protease n=1 Tax=Thermomonas sp. TaxID=1971895 RepID=UPI0024886EDD|nr:rhomboid family intramembrane serine protease [Thermomonas sp.]MDI1252241.1 rhomboid family intramembrane serine protease [Thermomonas sp.]